MYRALKPIKIGDTIRRPGEFVPEAAGWKNVRAYLGARFLEEVPDEWSTVGGSRPATARTSGRSPRGASRETGAAGAGEQGPAAADDPPGHARTRAEGRDG